MNHQRPTNRAFHGRLFTVAATVSAIAACETPRLERSVDGIDVHKSAATLLSGFVDEQVTEGLENATAMAFAPDGRIFVTEQRGTVRVVKNGALLATPFVTVSVDDAGERGLLGLTFDPEFASNGFVYVYYTATTPAVHNRISRFTASGDVAVAGSERILLELDNLASATNHNGGALHFGADGKLYVAVGENSDGDNAQSTANLLGKMLRLNADGTIPTDNPFFATTSGNRRAIWALGLRNPFTFDVQPGTGTIFINDVGHSVWEEINQGVAGANYGWPTTEGPTNDARFRSPLHSYGHGTSASTGCAITGGAFYNPPTATFPASYTGKYFFADFCGGWIRLFDPATGNASAFASNVPNPVDLRVGSDGALYYLARGTGTIGRIRATATAIAPSITAQPQSQTRAVGQAAEFSVTAAGSAPLSYQWQRDGVNISGATGDRYTLPQVSASDGGASFRVVVSNGVGTVTSASATLTVTSDQAPVAAIVTPAAGETYAAGTVVSYGGSGTDPETGELPATAFSWSVVFHHDSHTHPFLGPVTGVTGGSFTIPDRGETATNVFYRVHLTVTDPSGLTHTTFQDLRPRTAVLSLATSPAGLQVTVDGQPVTTPASITSVVGMIRTLGVVSPQTSAGTTYAFTSWSDSGAATHDVTTPEQGGTYVATYAGSTAQTGLRGDYYDDRNLTIHRLSRTDATVDFNWGTGAPAPEIAPDTFSVRWSGRIVPRFSEVYTFATSSDDGVRLRVNGVSLIDNWTDHAPTENRGSIRLTAGTAYDIQMDYYENGGGAVARLLWSSPSQPRQIVPSSALTPAQPSGLRGEYFDDLEFTNSRLVRTDPTIDFDWERGAPTASMGVDSFSVRWTGRVTAASSETYTFYTTSDDGVRLWIDGQLIIDNWTDHASTEDTGTAVLSAGVAHDVRMEYYERGGGALAGLAWSSPSQPRQIIPASRLSPP